MKTKKSLIEKILGYIITIAIISIWIWSAVNGGGSGYGCYDDEFGNEICHEDPRR